MPSVRWSSEGGVRENAAGIARGKNKLDRNRQKVNEKVTSRGTCTLDHDALKRGVLIIFG